MEKTDLILPTGNHSLSLIMHNHRVSPFTGGPQLLLLELGFFVPSFPGAVFVLHLWQRILIARTMVNPSIEIVTFIDAFGVALVITLIPFFTKELGVDAFGFGMITSLYGLCQIVGGCIIGYISKFKVSRKTILLVSAFGSAISYALLLIRNNLYTLVASRMIVGFIKQTTTSCKVCHSFPNLTYRLLL